jgi:hypothetical protein
MVSKDAHALIARRRPRESVSVFALARTQHAKWNRGAKHPRTRDRVLVLPEDQRSAPASMSACTISFPRSKKAPAQACSGCSALNEAAHKFGMASIRRDIKNVLDILLVYRRYVCFRNVRNQ